MPLRFKAVNTLFAIIIIFSDLANAETMQIDGNFEEYPNIVKMFEKNNIAIENKESFNEKTFWDDRYKGWFFYEPMDKEDEDEKKKITKQYNFINWTEFKKLSAKDMRNLINELKELAIANPSENNVQTYMVAQKIATNKAVNFMKTWQDILKEHPSLDETVKQPGSQYASYQLKAQESKIQEEIIKKLSQDDTVGILLMHSDENYYSNIQKPIFRNFIESTKWKTYSFVNVDEYPDIITKYGVETLPEVWLTTKDGKSVRVSAGLRTQDVIESGIIQAWEKIIGKKIMPEPYKYAENSLSDATEIQK